MESVLDRLPEQVASLADVSKILPPDYLRAAGIFHIFGKQPPHPRILPPYYLPIPSCNAVV
jgi:hypothetical protein